MRRGANPLGLWDGGVAGPALGASKGIVRLG
jgi:hypothetical protein